MGVVVLETIFGLPGVGKLKIDSILHWDFTFVMAAIMVIAAAIFVMNLLIDILYSILDPRIRYQAMTHMPRSGPGLTDMPKPPNPIAQTCRMLCSDKLAFASMIFLTFVLLWAMSFPSLLLAVVVLFMLESSVFNLVIVLAIARIPAHLRTARAETLEVRERMFVQAARVMGIDAADHRPTQPAGGFSNAGHHRHAGFRLRDAGGIRALVSGDRHSSARDHVGADGVAGTALSDDRLRVVALARSGDHPDHAFA